MKKKIVTVLFITAFLFSILSGISIVKATTVIIGESSQVDFPYVSGIYISSPSNRTYKPCPLTLNASASGLDGGNTNVTMSYILDETHNETLPVVVQYRENSFVVTYKGDAMLPELSYGSHHITVYLEFVITNLDMSGVQVPKHTSRNESVDFTISDTIPLEETTPPKISNLSLENKTYNSAEIPFSFNVDKPVSLITYSLDNQTNKTIAYLYKLNTSDRQFDTTLKELSDGSHSLTVYATDMFDNTGVSDTVSFTVDTVCPAISNLTIQNETYTSNELELNYSVTEATSWMAYCLDNQANVTILGNITIAGLLNGQHNITVYANDTAGNTGTVFFSVEVPEPFPTALVMAFSVSVAIASLSILFYFRKPRKKG